MSTAGFALAVPLGAAFTALQPKRQPDLVALRAEEPRLWINGLPAQDLGRRGTILGAVHDRQSGSGALAATIERDVENGARQAAINLLTQCWGAYAAVIVDPAARTAAVLVDPSGLLPVYSLQTHHHLLVASSMALLERCTQQRLQVDWSELHAFLCRPEMRQRKTCLLGVRELRPGSLTTISANGIEEELLWRAEAFMPKPPYPSFEETTRELRETATAVMGAWEKTLGPVAVAASGGVDSSLICGALYRAGAPFSCVTTATADPSGDERAAVRGLARHLGIPIVEAVYDPVRFDPLLCASAGLPRPSRKSFLNEVDRLFSEAAEELGAAIVLDGNGGDNLFCYLHSAAPIVDRLRAVGPGPGALATFLDLCRITGCDLGVMAAATWRRSRRPARLCSWPPDERLLANPAPPFETVDPLSPWLDIPTAPHGGKHDHLALIMRSQTHSHGLGATVARFSPLMSQPILELCLSVPTWLWCTGGLNRAPARHAFADVLPPTLLARMSKAGPDSYIRAVFEHNRAAIRLALLDGVLTQRGLLDLPAVERALTTDVVTGDSMVYRLLDLAEAENWARAWRV